MRKRGRGKSYSHKLVVRKLIGVDDGLFGAFPFRAQHKCRWAQTGMFGAIVGIIEWARRRIRDYHIDLFELSARHVTRQEDGSLQIYLFPDIGSRFHVGKNCKKLFYGDVEVEVKWKLPYMGIVSRVVNIAVNVRNNFIVLGLWILGGSESVVENVENCLRSGKFWDKVDVAIWM